MLPVRTCVQTFQNKGSDFGIIFGDELCAPYPRVMKNAYVLSRGTSKIMELKTGHFLFIGCLIRDDFRPESTKSENRGVKSGHF